MFGEIWDSLENFAGGMRQHMQQRAYENSMYQRFGPDWQSQMKHAEAERGFEREEMDFKRREMAFEESQRPLMVREDEANVARAEAQAEKARAEAAEKRSTREGTLRAVTEHSVGNSDPFSQIIQASTGLSPDDISEMGGKPGQSMAEWKEHNLGLADEYMARTGAHVDLDKAAKDRMNARLGLAKDSADLQHVESGAYARGLQEDVEGKILGNDRTALLNKMTKEQLEENSGIVSPKQRKIDSVKAQQKLFSDISNSVFNNDFQEMVNNVEMQKLAALEKFRGGQQAYGAVPRGVTNMKEWNDLQASGAPVQRLANPQMAAAIEGEIIKKFDQDRDYIQSNAQRVFTARVMHDFEEVHTGLLDRAAAGEPIDELEKEYLMDLLSTLDTHGISAVNADPGTRKLIGAILKRSGGG